MKILLTIVVCIIVGVAGALGVIYSGIYDVSASKPDNALVQWALHTASEHSVDARLDGIVAPGGLDAPQVVAAGGHLYAAHCAVCHGGPGLKPTAISVGLNPQPPDFFRAGHKPWLEQMFRFIKYGVKMTAMPAFGKSFSDEQVWQLAAFLRTAPGMSAADFAKATGVGGGG